MRVRLGIAVWVLGACEPVDTDSADLGTESETETETESETETDVAMEVFRLPAVAEVNTEHSATSKVCANCHSNASSSVAMLDAAGRGVSPSDLSRASMMSLSARDPVYRTAVAVEAARHPSVAVQAECTPCHAPLAAMQIEASGVGQLDHSLLYRETDLGDLARDGATCAACHRLDPVGLGDPTTWSGAVNYVSDPVIYGPYEGVNGGAMTSFTGFAPTHGEHIRDPELCAGCHTLFTDTLDGDDQHTGDVLPEQTPYLEWRASDYNTERGHALSATCQACHFPQLDVDGDPVRTVIARSPSGRDYPRLFPRSPYGRHLISGGNTAVLGLFRDHQALLSPDISVQDIERSIATVRRQLRERTATLKVEATVVEGRLVGSIAVRNLTGHKLPTGIPIRRMWLEVSVDDADARRIIHLGAADAGGRILVDGAPVSSESVGGPVQPHRTVIRGERDLVIWESIMATPDGEPTEALLLAASYVKDNRLLPAGWADEHASIRPVGVLDDPDFHGGGDGVQLDVPLSGVGPWKVVTRLHYQSVNPRFLASLLRADVPEARGLAQLVGDGLPSEIIAEVQVVVQR